MANGTKAEVGGRLRGVGESQNLGKSLAGASLVLIAVMGVVSVLEASNDNSGDPDDKDPWWKKLFNPDWHKPGY